MGKSCVKQNNINLKMALNETDLSWAEIARRIGCNRSIITNWFNDIHFPSEKYLQKLLPILNEIQKEKGKIPYTISYLRGDTNCKVLDNEKIYNRVYLKDEAIETLEKIGTTEIKRNQNVLIPNTNPLTYIATFNYVISKKELWEILYTETEKSLKDNLKEIKAKYTNGTDIKEIHKIIETLDVSISSQLNSTIKNILNGYIKELLGYYFPNE